MSQANITLRESRNLFAEANENYNNGDRERALSILNIALSKLEDALETPKTPAFDTAKNILKTEHKEYLSKAKSLSDTSYIPLKNETLDCEKILKALTPYVKNYLSKDLYQTHQQTLTVLENHPRRREDVYHSMSDLQKKELDREFKIWLRKRKQCGES